MFKGHCFPKDIILQAVYFKLRFSLSYRDVEELLQNKGVNADHATIQRWVLNSLLKRKLSLITERFEAKIKVDFLKFHFML